MIMDASAKALIVEESLADVERVHAAPRRDKVVCLEKRRMYANSSVCQRHEHDSSLLDVSASQNRLTVEERYELVHQLFDRRFLVGRALNETRAGKSNVSLEFEIEFKESALEMTPELVLLRGGLNPLKDNDSSLFPHVSKWFEVGLDGGTFRRDQHGHRNQRWSEPVDALIEVGTIPVTPDEVLNSPLVSELIAWHQNFSSCPPNKICQIPGDNGHHPPLNYTWHLPPFRRSREFRVPDVTQFTIGLPLAKVPDLLALSPTLKSLLSDVNHVCDQRCSPEYKALISMASMTIEKARRWGSKQGCLHPKLLMQPWMVRSHFGDIASHVPKEELLQFVNDTLEVVHRSAGIDADKNLYQRRICDYLLFPEFAEVSGVVQGREVAGSGHNPSATKEFPVDLPGLLQVAQEMLTKKAHVNEKLCYRFFGIHGKRDDSWQFSPREWLTNITQGKDIMSDHDSPVTSNSLSGLVWKSMGHWRMSSSDTVYLECRGKSWRYPCFDGWHEEWSIGSWLKNVAKIVSTLA